MRACACGTSRRARFYAWLLDPDGNLIEIYARLTADELTGMPADRAPRFLVPEDGRRLESVME